MREKNTGKISKKEKKDREIERKKRDIKKERERRAKGSVY